MRKKRLLNLSVRIALFVLILLAGTTVSLLLDETESIASVDLSQASFETVAMVETGEGATLYAAFVGGPQPTGLARSENFGQTWQIIGTGPAGMTITDLAVHPNNTELLFASSNRNADDPTEGLWASADGGQTWEKYPLALPIGVDRVPTLITAVALDPNEPTVLYVGTEGQGVYRYKTDTTGFGYERLGDIAAHNLYVKDMVVGADSRAYVLSTNGIYATDGTTWEALTALPDVALTLAIDPTMPQTLYAGTVGYGAFRSTDGGQTWQAINNGLGWQPGVILRVSAIDIDPENPLHVALATAMTVGSHTVGVGIYESFDAGATWQTVTTTSDIITDLTLVKNGLFVATPHGLVRYGNPLPVVPPPAKFSLDALANPNGMQVLVMLLTLALGGLVLLRHPAETTTYQQTPA